MRPRHLIPRFLLPLAAATLALAPSSDAGAGGWAVTSVDPFDAPAAGEPLEIGFTILQHGRTPVDVDGVVIVVDDNSGDEARFPAEPAGTVGRYRATIEFPSAGSYDWSVIQGWFGPQDLGTLDITGGGTSASWTAPWVLAPLAVIGAGAAGAVLFLRRDRMVTARSPG